MAVGAFYTATISGQLKGISDAIVTDIALLQVLKDKGRITYGNGGDGGTFRVRNSRSAIGGSTSDWAEAGASSTNPFTSFSYTYRQLAWRLVVSKFQIQRNENAGPEAKMFDLVTEQLNELKQAATHRIGTHLNGDGSTLSTGDAAGTTPMSGLSEVIDDNNTYLGTARSGSTAYWNAQVNSVTNFHLDDDSDGVTNGINAMRILWQDCSQGKQTGSSVSADIAGAKDTPDYIITDATGYLKYQNSLTPQDRYSGETDDPEKKLLFNAIPITWDTVTTAAKMWFLNTRHLTLEFCGSKILDMMQEQDISSPLAKTWTIGTQGQLYSKNPRNLGLLDYT